ncbi:MULTISPECIES: helix-hairpin-helix domain-containing protein [Pandoraea]|uniref:ComEA family DNA-binding protein n=1 Tax=Pandoraea TaxID=93217 RepID=UPI001F5DD83D|nr:MULTISPECIES: helix-hairpin-helix domain-containing protein [Pandoraea]MCI3208555.1 hypothetical protein [Pandoraea sp. LA3]MDN4586584.1 hypothetical protein [Pandoraea capi]
MAITQKGRLWEWSRSLYLVFVCVPFLNFFAFAIAAQVARKRRWAGYAILYLVPHVLLFSIAVVVGGKKDLYPVLNKAGIFVFVIDMLALWPISLAHAIRIRRDVLIRAEEASDAIARTEAYEAMAQRRRVREMQASANRSETRDGGPNAKPGKRRGKNAADPMAEFGRSAHTGQEAPSKPNADRQPRAKRQVDATQKPVVDNVEKLDINSVTEEALGRHPLVGPILAKKMTVYRESGGTFRSVEHFCEVLNIQPHLVARLRDSVEFKAPRAPAFANKQRVVDY